MAKLKLLLAEEGSGLSVDSIRKIAADRVAETKILNDESDFHRYLNERDSDSCVVVLRAKDEARNALDGLERKVDERLQKILIMVGIPSHIKGSKFLRDAVKAAIGAPEMINNITKMLYPSIAQKNNTSASKVERAIRHAIEVSWNRGKIENINQIFGMKVFSRGDKPTNGELIALIADRMLIEIA